MSPAARSGQLDKTPYQRVSITTHARLHFGFFDPSGRSPEPFGSIGLFLDRPSTRLTLTRGDEIEATGPDAARAKRYLHRIATHLGRDGGYRLEVHEAIPAHAGLGSGTQLALAVGTAFAQLEGLVLSAREVAELLMRGARSGIGVGAFATGGLLLDSGPIGGLVPEIMARVPFPQDWRALLIFDEAAEGLHGSNETDAFTKAPDFPQSQRTDLRRRAQTIAMPAAMRGDFESFCAEVGRLQQMMGDYFAPFQGGAIISESVAGALGWLRSHGLSGVGQSSWGPTGFAFVPDAATGERLAEAAQKHPGFEGLRFELARGENRGAVIETR